MDPYGSSNRRYLGSGAGAGAGAGAVQFSSVQFSTRRWVVCGDTGNTCCGVTSSEVARFTGDTGQYLLWLYWLRLTSWYWQLLGGSRVLLGLAWM